MVTVFPPLERCEDSYSAFPPILPLGLFSVNLYSGIYCQFAIEHGYKVLIDNSKTLCKVI